MDLRCAKCGSTEVVKDIPVVSSVDNLSAASVSALAFKRPDARIFKGPVTHRFTARICGSCGYAEFFVDDPKGLLLAVKQMEADA